MTALVLLAVGEQVHIPIEAQDFGEDEYENHSDEHFGFVYICADALQGEWLGEGNQGDKSVRYLRRYQSRILLLIP